MELPLPKAYIFGAEEKVSLGGQDLVPEESLEEKQEVSLPPFEAR